MSVWLLKATDEGGLDFGSDINRARLKEHLKEHAGKWYRLTYLEPKRSLSQNNYLHLYLDLVARETGSDRVSLKEHFIARHAPLTTSTIGKKTISRPKRTHEMTKLEVGEWLDKCAAECGVPLPDPNDLEGYIPN